MIVIVRRLALSKFYTLITSDLGFVFFVVTSLALKIYKEWIAKKGEWVGLSLSE